MAAFAEAGVSVRREDVFYGSDGNEAEIELCLEQFQAAFGLQYRKSISVAKVSNRLPGRDGRTKPIPIVFEATGKID
jgi:hypothetical protein